MSYQVGGTYPAAVSIRDATDAPSDPDALVLDVRAPDGTIATFAYGTDPEVVQDDTGEFHADIALDATGMWVIGWTATNPAQFAEVQVWVSAALNALFCSPGDIATRLGRDLTNAESGQVAMLCELATDTITAAADKDSAWVSTLTSVPRMLRILAIELVTRAMPNPRGLASTSESLGAYSYTERFSDAGGGGLMLTDAEERMVRRVVWKQNSASAQVDSLATTIADSRSSLIDGWATDTNPNIYEDA